MKKHLFPLLGTACPEVFCRFKGTQKFKIGMKWIIKGYLRYKTTFCYKVALNV